MSSQENLIETVNHWLQKLGTPGSQWGMQCDKGTETEPFEVTVDDTSRFSVGIGCWGLDGPTTVVSITDETHMIVKPIRTFSDMVKS